MTKVRASLRGVGQWRFGEEFAVGVAADLAPRVASSLRRRPPIRRTPWGVTENRAASGLVSSSRRRSTR